MHRFFAPDIETTMLLPEDEGQHCVRVLRLTAGDEIEVVDGKGNLFTCKIVEAGNHRCYVDIINKVSTPPHWGCNITIAIAPTKNMDRLEWMVEKAVELGVDRIIPILCRYSERKVLKVERLRKIAVSAMKQSLKTTLPVIDELTPIRQIIESGFDGQRFIAYCDKETERRNFLKEYNAGGNVLVMVGPEGDFSKEEVALSIQNDFMPVTFGESRLRTETAGVFACAAVHSKIQLK